MMQPTNAVTVLFPAFLYGRGLEQVLGVKPEDA